jgi:hypothetical protein
MKRFAGPTQLVLPDQALFGNRPLLSFARLGWLLASGDRTMER